MGFYHSGRGKKIHEWLTVEEIELLIRAADNARDQVLITFGYFSGLRVAEISNTQVKDIDWKEGTLKVRQGKGSKDRIVAVHPVLKGILEKWLRSVIDDSEAFLFPGTIRDQGMTTRQIHRIVSDTAKRAGIKKRVHPHTLRHAIATHLYKDCKDIVVVSNFLGHSSVSTTQIYADADIDDQILAMAKL